MRPNFKTVGSCNHIHQYDLRKFKGRVFVVSDLHGCYDLLHEAMSDYRFDTSKDMLIAAGDNVDRNMGSRYVLDYICEPWFISISGNHEAMYVEAYESGFHPDNRSVRTLKANGGEWVWTIDASTQSVIYDVFKSLPLAIELLLPDGEKIGIVHAETPYGDWDMFKNISSLELDWHGIATAQWSRSKYDRKNLDVVAGVDVVITGHTPTKSGDVEQLGNNLFIDAGSFFRDKIHFIEIDKQFMEDVKCQRWVKCFDQT